MGYLPTPDPFMGPYSIEKRAASIRVFGPDDDDPSVDPESLINFHPANVGSHIGGFEIGVRYIRPLTAALQQAVRLVEAGDDFEWAVPLSGPEMKPVEVLQEPAIAVPEFAGDEFVAAYLKIVDTEHTHIFRQVIEGPGAKISVSTIKPLTEALRGTAIGDRLADAITESWHEHQTKIREIYGNHTAPIGGSDV